MKSEHESRTKSILLRLPKLLVVLSMSLLCPAPVASIESAGSFHKNGLSSELSPHFECLYSFVECTREIEIASQLLQHSSFREQPAFQEYTERIEQSLDVYESSLSPLQGMNSFRNALVQARVQLEHALTPCHLWATLQRICNPCLSYSILPERFVDSMPFPVSNEKTEPTEDFLSWLDYESGLHTRADAYCS